jgi:sugar O-acyltransferase (sialic acid O-acetyltransferase NeuD family)
MDGVVLVAAGGLARETLAALRASDPTRPVVVLDDDPARLGASVGDAQVVGNIEDVKRYDDHAVVVCAGKGSVRRTLVERLAALGVQSDRYASVVHPLASVPDSCSLGAGSIVLAGVVLTADVTVGRHVVLMPHVTLTHDDVVGDYATLAAGVTLGGSVHVGAGAYLGMGAGVRENLRVGEGAVLGMGSVALEDVPDDETWVGAPARTLGPRP